MSHLFQYSSNRTEVLAAELAKVLKGGPGDPFAREVIVVPTRGLSRWLSMRLAESHGICMRCKFPFPQAFIREIIETLSPEELAVAAIEREPLAWRIYAALGRSLSDPVFAPVSNYLAGGDPLKRYQLAARIANLFDQYILYRPRMILDWESGKVTERESWQAALWRELIPPGTPHLPAVHKRIATAIEQSDGQADLFSHSRSLPSRVSVFGVSMLPPLYWDLLFRLSHILPVHLFQLEPSQVYYGLDSTPKQAARSRRKALRENPTRATGADFVGHPLLTSLGRLHRDRVDLQIKIRDETCASLVDSGELFRPPGDEKETLLHWLQTDLLEARPRAELKETAAARSYSPEDNSIEVHACHSPLREMEVLRDRLLALFEAIPDLRPRDVLVMLPDIETYVPAIHAVFRTCENELQIPYSVADRTPRARSPMIATFLKLLSLPDSRFGAEELLGVIASPPAQARFGFSANEMDRLRDWVFTSGIRWGVDPAHRAKNGADETPVNTWLHGLDRLLLGWASPAEFNGIQPCGEAEGESELLARFCEAVKQLCGLESLARQHSASDWAAALDKAASDCLFPQDEEAAEDFQQIRLSIAQLHENIAAASPDEELPLAVVRHALFEMLNVAHPSQGFLTGGVTFCALQPMRAIPARVIWLAGMSDGAFPRQPVGTGFDLMADKPEPGDRNLRDDDRYLFLETILSARSVLGISYVGRSVETNDEFPPSVIVSELLDALDQTASFGPHRDARGALVVEHPLHAFSRRYFDQRDPRLFTYSKANAAAARAGAGMKAPAPFISESFELPCEMPVRLDLRDLIRFFEHPSRWFARERLGIWFSDEEEALPDCEAFDLSHLDAYTMASEIFHAELNGADPLVIDKLVADARLAPGGLGHAQHSERREFAMKVHARHREIANGSLARPPATVEIKAGDCILSHTVRDLFDKKLILPRFASIKPKHKLRLWIQHLAMCAAEHGKESVLVGEKEEFVLGPPPDPHRLLASLVKIYCQGLTRPLPFFPEASLAFVSAKDEADAEKKATNAWDGFGDSVDAKDPYVRLLYPRIPLGERFAEVARAVFAPMLEVTVE